MQTPILINDETAQTRLLLQNAAPTEVQLHEPEAVGGCNCDRWGHPCPSRVKRNIQMKAERPFSLPLDE